MATGRKRRTWQEQRAGWLRRWTEVIGFGGAALACAGAIIGLVAVWCDGPTPPVPHVHIAEVIYDPEGAEPAEECITLYNSGSTTVDLSGYSLTDRKGATYRIPPGVTLKPKGKWTVRGETYNPHGSSSELMLNNRHDIVRLTDREGNCIDEFEW